MSKLPAKTTYIMYHTFTYALHYSYKCFWKLISSQLQKCSTGNALTKTIRHYNSKLFCKIFTNETESANYETPLVIIYIFHKKPLEKHLKVPNIGAIQSFRLETQVKPDVAKHVLMVIFLILQRFPFVYLS